MTYLSELAEIVKINSYTKNKEGVDRVGFVFDRWLKELGFSVEIYQREEIGDHRHYKSLHIDGAKKLLLLGH
ncbi:M20 family peptidase, partial [Sulfurimonas sp. SAG-AH-194-C20]|nr:M20 family peptidase [Sulfurimonas sp. SAG-AH-194-C20]